MADSLDLLICSTCGTQYSVSTSLSSCKICDDPRQYVPPAGQSWTTLRALHTAQTYKNIFTPDPTHPTSLISIHTVPRHAIGQRAYICRTPHGNILWDCIAYIDEETIAHIRELGGLTAIIISHPHYFTTNLYWAEIFDCPVYLSVEDEEWVMRKGGRQVLWAGREISFPLSGPSSEVSSCGGDRESVVGETTTTGFKSGGGDLVAIKTAGHFPGSSVLWWKSLKMLLIADTIAVIPSGMYWVDRVPGTASFTFMWSYPNMIPLNADDVYNIWKAIKHTEFDITHGAFLGTDTHIDSKKRLLDSAKIFVRAMGYLDHAIHQEECL